MSTTTAPEPLLLTSQAARRLDVPESRLRALIRSKRISEPQRVGNTFAWSEADLQAARAALGLPEGASHD